jgi:hypothetical protein
MTGIEEIAQAVERLPLTDFVRLALWVEQRRKQLKINPSASDNGDALIRDHAAFLSGYAPQDEGLYDDAAAR